MSGIHLESNVCCSLYLVQMRQAPHHEEWVALAKVGEMCSRFCVHVALYVYYAAPISNLCWLFRRPPTQCLIV